MNNSDLNTDQISEISKQLLEGKVGVFPHDTIWGLIGIVSSTVVERIAQLKDRPPDQPFLLLIPNLDFLPYCTEGVEKIYWKFIQNLWPGPYTLIFKKNKSIPDWVTAGKPTIAIRLPAFSPLNSLLNKVNRPILSTSVNKSSQKQMQTLQDGDKDILNNVDFIYKGFEPFSNEASTIIDCSNKIPKILRPGKNEEAVKKIIEDYM